MLALTLFFEFANLNINDPCKKLCLTVFAMIFVAFCITVFAKVCRTKLFKIGDTFWNYVYDVDRYNFTYEDFINHTETDLQSFGQFVINAKRDKNYKGQLEG